MDTSISESEMIHYNHKDLQPGGIWEPGGIGEPCTCVSCYHVAIIIPYRDRFNHLRILLHVLIPVLQRQHIKFRIFVVEQVSLLLGSQGPYHILKGLVGQSLYKLKWHSHFQNTHSSHAMRIYNNVVCEINKTSDQPAHTRKYTLVKMPHCWKSHVAKKEYSMKKAISFQELSGHTNTFPTIVSILRGYIFQKLLLA